MKPRNITENLLSDNEIIELPCNIDDIQSLKKVELFRIYEFTDQLQIIDRNTKSYPSIFNFVKTGILTEEEAWQALRRK